MIRRVCKYLREGNYFEPACIAAGLGKGTGDKWRKRGERGEAPEYIEFFNQTYEAEAKGETGLVKEARKRDPNKVLKRRFKERWGDSDSDMPSGITVKVWTNGNGNGDGNSD